MVGTEDGMIHTCSLKYNRNYVSSVQGHHMPVYRISYNFFNNSIYASCAGDWRVKIWEDGREYVIFLCHYIYQKYLEYAGCQIKDFFREYKD